MNDDALRHQAEQAGLAPSWDDVHGHRHQVSPETLRAVLVSLGTRRGDQVPPLITAEIGQPTPIPGMPAGDYWLQLEDGTAQTGRLEPDAHGAVLPAIDRPGYHRLEHGEFATTIAVAPARCWTIADATAGRPGWGLTAQLYGLAREGDGGIGDFVALAQLATAAGRAGATAFAISPVHAQFAADPGNFSPYAASSRGLLNVVHADPGVALPARGALLEWDVAAPRRLAALRQLYDTTMAEGGALDGRFREFRADRGEALEYHAVFEALHAAQLAQSQSQGQGWSDWRQWPAELRDPASPSVARFAAQHAAEVGFHAFAQFLADQGLREAQHAARSAGMAIGLITDVAIGVSHAGSDAWRLQGQLLSGLNVGAPPDLFNTVGQDWGITTYAPAGLAAHGYGAFLDMLRAAWRHAGGLRLDHVMGLSRLWVVPHGAPASQGVYLSYPAADLLRLVRLESHRHRGIVLGEDLGTLPFGFQGVLEAQGIAGMRVMWFERDRELFTDPGSWSPGAVAMTSTHDLATVAGWWSGNDLAWRTKLGQPATEPDLAERARDRVALWNAFCHSGAAAGDAPPPDQTAPVADAAAAHLGTAACGLALLPLEDALALTEQPNLPNTTTEHPNWRRRLDQSAATVLEAPAVAARIASLARARPGPDR